MNHQKSFRTLLQVWRCQKERIVALHNRYTAKYFLHQRRIKSAKVPLISYRTYKKLESNNSKLVQSTCVPWTTLFKKSNSICEHTWWTIWRHKSQAESLQYHKSYKCFRTGSWLSRRWLNHASARDPSTKTTNFQFFWCQFALHIKTDVNLKNSLYRDLSILAQGS